MLKLIKHEFVVSSAGNGHSHRIMWLKCSNNDRGNTSCDFLKEAINEHIAPLKVRGNKGSENRLIEKCMVMVLNTQC